MLCFNRRCGILLLILVLLCVICVESKAKKWRAHIKKKTNSPKISASYRIVISRQRCLTPREWAWQEPFLLCKWGDISPKSAKVTPKRKIIHKHKTAPHKRNPKMNYYHPLPSSWPTHTMPPPTYYLASSYPRYRSYITTPTKTITTLRKFDPYLSSSFPLRRSDEFDASSTAFPSTTLTDMSGFNVDFADGYFDPGLHMSRDFVQPEISLGGWTPIDYKSFMADADFSLLSDQMGLSRQLDGGGVLLNDFYEPQFI